MNPLIFRMDSANKLAIIQKGLSKGAAGAASRILESTNPLSWEFSGFSQNGEDGIIDYLTRKIDNPNNYFLEIGASNGIDNNSAWLAFVRNYNGLMLDGDPESLKRAKSIKHNMGVEYLQMFVNKDNTSIILDRMLYSNPDMVSLDIDGIDYYVAKSLIENGLRPKIFIVEYNSTFGPNQEITVDYKSDFNISEAHDTNLYYGVSVAGWRKFLSNKGYQFVTVDSNGVNAIFVDRKEFDKDFLAKLKGIDFNENFYQHKKFNKTWEQQFELVKNMSYYKID